MNWIINTIAGKLTEIKTGYAPGSTFTGLSECAYYIRTYTEAQQLVTDCIIALAVTIFVIVTIAITVKVCQKKFA